jgi:hypothetical protein
MVQPANFPSAGLELWEAGLLHFAAARLQPFAFWNYYTESIFVVIEKSEGTHWSDEISIVNDCKMIPGLVRRQQRLRFDPLHQRIVFLNILHVKVIHARDRRRPRLLLCGNRARDRRRS